MLHITVIYQEIRPFIVYSCLDMFGCTLSLDGVIHLEFKATDPNGVLSACQSQTMGKLQEKYDLYYPPKTIDK